MEIFTRDIPFTIAMSCIVILLFVVLVWIDSFRVEQRRKEKQAGREYEQLIDEAMTFSRLNEIKQEILFHYTELYGNKRIVMAQNPKIFTMLLILIDKKIKWIENDD